MKIRFILACLLATGLLHASGKKTPVTPLAPNIAEIRVLNEIAPPGGTVQVKYSLTEPRPITSGGTGIFMGDMDVNGVAISSASGTSAGAAVVRNGLLFITTTAPLTEGATPLDYPFLTVTMSVHASATAGSTFPLNLQPGSWLASPTGPLNVEVKPGTLTIGGKLSIQGVYPGGGTWPAGTVVSIRGSGFQQGAILKTPGMKVSGVKVVSPAEIQFSLQLQTTLDATPLQVINPDGSSQTYYSYLRGVPVRPASKPLLRAVEPVFAQTTHGYATIKPLPVLSASQYIALALQNPSGGPVVATVEVTHADGALAVAPVLLLSGQRILDDLHSLTGTVVLPGDSVRIFATSAIQMLGLVADDASGTVTPFLPSF